MGEQGHTRKENKGYKSTVGKKNGRKRKKELIEERRLMKNTRFRAFRMPPST